MGIYVSLRILSDRIDPNDWADFYDETVQFLQNADHKLVGLKEQRIQLPQGEYKRTIYSQAFDQIQDGKRFWRINGDLGSYGAGESFLLYRDLDHYRRRPDFCGKPGRPAPKPESGYDILKNILREYFHAIRTPQENDKGPVDFMETVFDAKTQGHPFHHYMLAVGMLAEDRFAQAAFVSGDIDRFQAANARDGIQTILERQVDLPLCTHPERLLQRIMAYHQGIAAMDAFDGILRYDRQRDIARIYQTAIKFLGNEVFTNWVSDCLKQYETPHMLGAKEIMIDWLNAGHPLADLIRLGCVQPAGPRFAPLETVKSLLSLWLTIEPEKRNAWHLLEKPPGAANTIASVFGNILLDTLGGAQGRNLKAHVPPDALIATVARFFPAEKQAISKMVNRQTRELENIHAQISAPLTAKIDALEKDAGVLDGTPFLQLTDITALTPVQREWLDSIAFFIWHQLAHLEKTESGAHDLFFQAKNRDRLHTQIVLGSERSNTILSEQAWQWIDGEQDIDILTTLTILALSNESEQKFYHTKQAIMEKRWLCEWITQVRMDSEKMHHLKNTMDKILKARKKP